MPSTEWQLGLRKIYILPSRLGVLWLASAALLILVAIQTGSNSTLLLAFLLLGVMALAMVLTHDNLDGVTLRCATPVPGFAQEVQLYPVLVVAPLHANRCNCALRGSAPKAPSAVRLGNAGWTCAGPRPSRSTAATAVAAGQRCAAWVVHLLDPLAASGSAVDLARSTARPCRPVIPDPCSRAWRNGRTFGPCAAAIVRLSWTGQVQPKVDRCRPSSSAILRSVTICFLRPPACPWTPPSNTWLNVSGSCIIKVPATG